MVCFRHQTDGDGMTSIICTLRSRNIKTGPIPVTTSSDETCPDHCPLREGGCYAKGGKLGMLWRMLSENAGAPFKFGAAVVKPVDWNGMCNWVATLKDGQIWRHNQAGDLPHRSGRINRSKLYRLVEANMGRKGFTYTHHEVLNSAANRDAVAEANRLGFTINLSGNNPRHADRLAELDIGPVVTVLPASVDGSVTKSLRTPAGRVITVCPATYRDTGPGSSCAMCGLCAMSRNRSIIGFPAHGASTAKASHIATN